MCSGPSSKRSSPLQTRRVARRPQTDLDGCPKLRAIRPTCPPVVSDPHWDLARARAAAPRPLRRAAARPSAAHLRHWQQTALRRSVRAAYTAIGRSGRPLWAGLLRELLLAVLDLCHVSPRLG